MSEAEGTITAEAPAAVPAEGSSAEALAAAVAAAPAPAAEVDIPAPAEEDVDLDTEAGDDVFADPAKARALAEKYRKEAAKRRVEAKEAKEQASEWAKGWSADDAKVLSEVIQLAAADPKVGAAKMREIAALLDGGKVEEAAAVAAGASEAAAEAAKPLTSEDVDAKVKEALDTADKARQVTAKRDEIVAKTKELGYDPGDVDYFAVLHIAQHETGGDLDKAHEKMEARKQAVIDAYVEGVRDRAEGQPLHARRGDDSVIEPRSDIKTWDDAREAMEAKLVAIRKGAQS